MSLKGSCNSEKIWNYFQEKGLSDCGIAGLLGNLDCESGLSPKNLENTYEKKLGYSDEEYCAAVDNGSYTNFITDCAGWGLCQWTYHTRKKALYEYAKSKNKSVGDLEMQLDFLYEELSESYPTVLKTLKNATSILEASNAVLLKFECPADQSVSIQNKRASYGQKYYDKYAMNGNKEGESVMGYKTCTKGKSVKLSANFNSSEFDCHGNGCCSQTLINETLVEYLQKIRDHFGKPITITSAYRCNQHNKNVGGATGSRHSKGDAADISVKDITPREVAKYAESIGIKGVGLYETSKDGYFVHIDTRTTKSFWYGQAQAKRTTFGGDSLEQTNNNTQTTTSVVILDLGDKGDAVKELQNNLIALGYSCGPDGADGVFGGKTENAVMQFQAKNGLAVDGIAGYQTISAINKAISNKTKKVKVTASVLNVRAGAGTNYAIKTTVRKGSVHEVLEEKNGWGKISNGWISLEYTEKV